MNKNIFFLLIASQLGLHASMHQSALTKKTTKTVREYIVQHKTTIGFVAAASLAAYHYREPIVGYIKNIFSSDSKTTGTADAAQNSLGSLDTRTPQLESGVLASPAISHNAPRDLATVLAAHNLISGDRSHLEILEQKDAEAQTPLTAHAAAYLAAAPTTSVASASTNLAVPRLPRPIASNAMVNIGDSDSNGAEHSALIKEAVENIVSVLTTFESDQENTEVQPLMQISPRVQAIGSAQAAITYTAPQSPRDNQ
jgi:hypothetical protein